MGKPLRDAELETSAVCAVLRAEACDGRDEECEALLKDLAYRVRAEEEGCFSYVVTRALGSRTHFAVHARFADMEAFNGHAETEHLKRAMPRLSALLASPISMEIFFAI